MIGRLTGDIINIESEVLILDVNGVGYEINCSQKILSLFDIGKKISLIIVTQMKDNGIQLFGFNNINEKNAFLLLKSVNGVGSKLALIILNYFSPENLELLVISKEYNNLRQIPGVGKKLAERIILELKNKLICIEKSSIRNDFNNKINDVLNALINLGLSKNEAMSRLRSIPENIETYNIEDLIKLSLQQHT